MADTLSPAALRVAFAGTPEFAACALEAILEAGYTVPLVLTQPDRPAGRGMKLTPSAVKQLALARGIEVDQPERLRTDEQRARLSACAPDVLVVAAYGLILPKAVLDMPRLGCLNIHASLLPRWRGAAPIQRAIEAGDPQTGITIMQMDEGLDTGDIVAMEAVPIGPAETAGSLHDRLADLGARLVVQALRAAEAAPLPRRPQPDEGVTYAHKIDKAEAMLDWSAPAALLERRVRAFDPVPGAATTLDGAMLKVWGARAEPGVAPSAAPGMVLAADAAGIRVQTGQGVLVLTEVQRAGGKRQAAGDFLRGTALPPGVCLGATG